MDERRFFELDLRLGRLRQRRQDEAAHTTLAFQERLELVWIYHDSALEGVVLTYREIMDALAEMILTDRRQGAIHKDIRAHKVAIDLINKQAQARQEQHPAPITIALLTRLHNVLIAEPQSKGSVYRNAKSPHRTYNHEIVSPDRIPQQLRELCVSLNEEAGSMHPLTRAASAHFDLMAIYPFAENNGKVARLLMNLLLLRDGYPPAVIPDFERQRYYASLRAEKECLAELIADTLNAYCDAATHFLDTL